LKHKTPGALEVRRECYNRQYNLLFCKEELAPRRSRVGCGNRTHPEPIMSEPGIDFLQLQALRGTSGDEAATSTLALLEKTTNEKLAELDEAIHANDIERCAMLAHYIKGGVSMLGMKRFADLVMDMEQHARAGRAVECAALLPRLRESFQRDMRALATTFSRLPR
jgi:HPt (histidine-containing phosphotransfer) domain-containing protein